jgi:hypothetical protein
MASTRSCDDGVMAFGMRPRRLSILAVVWLAACGGKTLTGGGPGSGPHPPMGGRGGSTGTGSTGTGSTGSGNTGTGNSGAANTGTAASSGGTGVTGAGGGGAVTGGGTGGSATTFQVTIDSAINNDLDLLFMIDNSSGMTAMQQKLMAQIPAFFQLLESLPDGLPNLHVAAISSDMGAPGDATSTLGCTAAGNQGQFQVQPRTCTSTTLATGATFLSDVGGVKNFTDPIEEVVQCIGQLGANGCGFEQPLASIARALGADGSPPPASNAGFLRPNAFLGIIILTNEDDCSAPADTTIYSLNGGDQSLSNPDGPLGNYRCYGGPRGGHLCRDSVTGEVMIPPLAPPADASGNPPVLNLIGCQDNNTGSNALTPVSKFVEEIKALKADPDHQIGVAAIVAPPDPYSVVWLPPASPPPGTSGQLWPEVMHSCGVAGGTVNPMATETTTDGSFGDPAVRVAQFVQSFAGGTLTSICDPSYKAAMSAAATHFGYAGSVQSCVVPPGNLQTDAQGDPSCTVVNHLYDSNSKETATVGVPSCTRSAGASPCWTLTPSAMCWNGGLRLHVSLDASASMVSAVETSLLCALQNPG